MTSYSSDLSCLDHFDIPNVKDECVHTVKNKLSFTKYSTRKWCDKQLAYLKFGTANEGEDFVTFLPVDQQPVNLL